MTRMPVAAPPASPPRSTRMLYGLAAFAPMGVAVAAVMLGSAADPDWYQTLLLPSFAPPLWLSGTVWTLVDLMIAYAFHRVLCGPDWMPDRPRAIRAFVMQAGLAVFWPLVFFVPHSPAAGAVAMVMLLVAVVSAGRLFGATDRKAGILLMLSGVWVGFQTLLMLSIFIRN